MAIYHRVVVVSVFLAFAVAAKAELKGSVTCLDCPQGYDLSGMQVLVKCEQVKKLAMAYTEVDGSFEARLPSEKTNTNTNTNTNPSKCMGRIMGGPQLIYVSAKESLVSFANDFSISKPLSFYRTCPLKGNKCTSTSSNGGAGFASSKTVDLPVPGEWGLPPSSYYVPFVPIIGIP